MGYTFLARCRFCCRIQAAEIIVITIWTMWYGYASVFFGSHFPHQMHKLAPVICWWTAQQWSTKVLQYGVWSSSMQYMQCMKTHVIYCITPAVISNTHNIYIIIRVQSTGTYLCHYRLVRCILVCSISIPFSNIWIKLIRTRSVSCAGVLRGCVPSIMHLADLALCLTPDTTWDSSTTSSSKQRAASPFQLRTNDGRTSRIFPWYQLQL